MAALPREGAIEPATPISFILIGLYLALFDTARDPLLARLAHGAEAPPAGSLKAIFKRGMFIPDI